MVNIDSWGEIKFLAGLKKHDDPQGWGEFTSLYLYISL